MNYFIIFPMNRFLVLITGLVVFISPVFAQGSMPEISLAPDQTQGFLLSPSSDDNKFIVKNELMRDIIILQNQINLLDGLVERQSEVQDIALNYERIGVPFRQPSPPRSTCEKLPLNVLCLFFYPELPTNQSIVSESIDRYEDRQQQRVDEAISLLRQKAIADARLHRDGDKPIVREKRAQYYWSDIKCKNAQCSAVIESNIDSNDKLRVQSGDVHVNGLKITKIDPRDGIVLAMYDGKKVEIKPLALSGSSSVSERKESSGDVFNEDEIVDLLRENINGGVESTPSIPQAPVTTSPPPMPVTNTPEALPAMLGSTGLF
jgi:hypothetical protein